MRYISHSIIAMALFVMLVPNGTLAQMTGHVKTVEAVGTGLVHGGDTVSARDQAISNSLATAIGLVMAEMAPLQTIVEKFSILNQVVLTHADQFIQGYKVLTEATTGRKYRVLVQATVSLDRIQEHLAGHGMALETDTDIRVLLLIAEQHLEDMLPRYWWGKSDAFVEAISESQIAPALTANGFSVINHAAVDINPPDGDLSFPLHLDNTQAVTIGRLFQADIVIVGTSVAESAPNAMGEALKSYKGTLTIRALRTETSVEIVSITQTALSAAADDISGSRNALAAVGEKAGTILATQLQSAWQSEAGTSKSFEVFVEGTQHLVHLVKFRAAVAKLPQVKDIKTREIMSNQALLWVDFEGTPQQFAEALLLKSFESFGIHINQVTPEQIRLSLVAQ